TDKPRRRMEDSFELWAACRVANGASAAHAAAQVCHAFAGAWRGPPFDAVDAGSRRHLDDADLHPCGRGAIEADLQSASSTRIAWGPEVIAGANRGSCGRILTPKECNA